MNSFASNPFATRFVSPGQVEWIGEDDHFEQLVSRWTKLDCRASIVGVHGSGKSTLLEHFVPRIADVILRRDAEGQLVARSISTKPISLQHINATEESLPLAVWLQLRRMNAQSMTIPWKELHRGRLLIIDGYEQLTAWRRVMLIARTRRLGVKLLVTSHRPTLLNPLCELSVSGSIGRQIVSQLATRYEPFASFSEEEIQSHLNAHAGNMREVLMDFYDRFESQRSLETSKLNSKC